MHVPPRPRTRTRAPRTGSARTGAVRGAAALLAGAAVVALAGCSSPQPRTAEQPITLAGGDTTVSVVRTTAGLVLADGEGRVLYARFPAAGQAAAPCTGACAAQWPAYAADGVPHPADAALNPLRTEVLDTVPAAGGGAQVGYAGHALHRFAGDPAPGAVTGQGVEAFGGTWLPLNPNGDPVPAAGLRR